MNNPQTPANAAAPRNSFRTTRSRHASPSRPASLTARVFIALLAISLFTPAVEKAIAEQGGQITFQGKHLRLYFQPRVRAGSQSGKTLREEVWRLNLTMNLVENYLEYLGKLGKIAPETTIYLEYNPEGADTPLSGPRIPISDLGMNSILQKVNEGLSQNPATARKFLVTERAALGNIKDQLVRNPETIEGSSSFENLSDTMKGLEPDLDFVVAGSRLITIRPTESGNYLTNILLSGSATVLLPGKNSDFANMQASPDGNFLAFTENEVLKIMNLGDRNPIPVLDKNGAASEKTLLDMAWSPQQNRLAGIVIDKKTLNREIFIYDTKKDTRFQNLEQSITGDYQFAYPFWSPDGNRLLFSSQDEISLIDLNLGKAFPSVVKTRGHFAEILWSPDSSSFAFVEILGQSRDKAEFNDGDFQSSILHRFRVSADGRCLEEESQKHSSRHSIKLLAFWTLDRILFLEGNLKSQHVSSPLWNLGKTFVARLTPGLSSSGSPLPASQTDALKAGPVDLPMKYCYAFKNLDSKFRNVYDSGLGHLNHCYLDRLTTLWFVGLDMPPEVGREYETFCIRPSPYPFPERNTFFAWPLSDDQIKPLLDMFASWQIRHVDFRDKAQTVYFLSNSQGPMTLWTGKVAKVSDPLLHQPQVPIPNESIAESASQLASETIHILENLAPDSPRGRPHPVMPQPSSGSPGEQPLQGMPIPPSGDSKESPLPGMPPLPSSEAKDKPLPGMPPLPGSDSRP